LAGSLVVVVAAKDWRAWHEAYAQPGSDLSRRLRLLQGELSSWLDGRPGEAITVVSVCAGQGHDLLGVLAARVDADRVRATLLEYDAGNVARAQSAVRQAGLRQVEIVQADAGELSTYDGLVPADLVLLAGVFGNISDADVRRTIGALPQLCAPGGTVLWTRTRRDPDLTPAVRRWLRDEGFSEQAFLAPADVLFCVGVHRFTGVPQPLSAGGKLFQFLT